MRFIITNRWHLLAALALTIAGLNTAAAQSSIELENSSWQLVAIHAANDTVFVPEVPQNHLLRFRMDNRLQIEADCNQAGATYNQDGNGLKITDLVTTRKLCVAPSLFNRYILNIMRTVGMRVEGENLIIQTDIASDWMEFEPYVFVPGVSN
ncbi:MAG: META domain-containing protein [Pseudomonadales bacterium]|nr:META domain-containing protein [Pseudomonadales bacterium]